MKVYLAGENGKQKILTLYDNILSEWNIKNTKSSISAIDRQTDRQRMNIYLAGGLSGNLSPLYSQIVGGGNFLAGEGYHQSEEFLNEAKNKMRVFLAGEGYHQSEEFSIQKIVGDITSFKDFNILESYYMLRDNEDFLQLLTRCNSYLIDSGAFTFMQGTHQGEIDWDKYIEEYADLINRWDVKLFFELDIDSIVGLDEVNRLRKKLERLTNK